MTLVKGKQSLDMQWAGCQKRITRKGRLGCSAGAMRKARNNPKWLGKSLISARKKRLFAWKSSVLATTNSPVRIRQNRLRRHNRFRNLNPQ